MKKGLFLDDERKPNGVTWLTYPKDVIWTIVRSYDEFVQEVTESFKDGITYDLISFDHDLSFNHYTVIGLPINYDKKEKTGYHAAVWMTQFYDTHKIEEPNFFVHSMNPVGKQNIYNHLFRWMESRL